MLGRTIAHFKILEKLGEGGMGDVYLAENTRLGLKVALKFLSRELAHDKTALKRFQNEARAVADLSHPNIARIHDIREDEGHEYLVLEYIEGRPLSEAVQEKPLSIGETLRIGLAVSDALSHAHAHGIVHRDVKSANIILTPDGDVKVMDFGLALRENATRITKTGATVGTVSYMSPEQASGNAADARSDLWSLGVVLYECLTSHLPFEAEKHEAILYKIVSESPEPPTALRTGIPLELERIVLKCLQRDPDLRHQHADDLLSAFKLLQEETKRRSQPPRLGRRPRRRTTLLTTVATIVLAVAGYWWFGLRGSAVGAEEKILVLPFAVTGQDDRTEFVGRAFAEAIAVDLSQAEGLSVLPVPQEGGNRLKDSRSTAEFGRSLGADHVVTGSLVRDGEKLDCTTTLVGARNNRVAWGMEESSPDGTIGDLSRSVSGGLLTHFGLLYPKSYMSPTEVGFGTALSDDPAVLELLRTMREARWDIAIRLSSELVDLYPETLEAHVLHFESLLRELMTSYERRTERELQVVMTRLDGMDADNPYTDYARALIMSDTKGYHNSAVRECTRLLQRVDLSPEFRASLLRARANSKMRFDDESAIDDINQAMTLAPSDFRCASTASLILRAFGRLEESELRARQAVAMRPNGFHCQQSLGLILSVRKRHEEAAEAYGKAFDISKNQPVGALYAAELWRIGKTSVAQGVAEECSEMTDVPYGTYNLACFHAVAGQPEKAKEYLRRALEVGYTSLWIERDPDLESLHGDPEFEDIVKEVKRLLSGE